MTQRLVWRESFRFTGVDSRGFELPIDGDGARGAKPSDLLPLSLAACTAYDVVNILTKQRQRIDSLEATIEAVQDPDPPWTFRRIAVRYVVRGAVEPSKARKALDLSESKYCSISATLRPSVELSFSIDVE